MKLRNASVFVGLIGSIIGLVTPLSTRAATPPDEALVLHLKLDGDGSDSSQWGNHGELLGEPEFSPDSPFSESSSILLSANQMGVSVPGSESLSGNSFTLTYWVKPTTLQEGAGLERLTSRGGDQFETAIGNAAALGGAPDLTLSYFQGGWIRTTASLSLNEWSHVAWRNSGPGPQGMELFVNGRLVYSGAGVPEGRPGIGIMNIGTRHNSTEGFEGLMDEVRLYALTLEAGDIVALATASDVDIDRLPDWWEIQNGLSAADNGSLNVANGPAGDPDNDGLLNEQEYANRTDPNVADTDGDGLNDAAELARGTQPKVADTDGDSLTDGDEVARGTSPLLRDTDGDGLPDGIEVEAGTNPLDPLSGPDPVQFLVLHLTFDGDTLDSSGLENHGQFLGEPQFVSETPRGGGSALSFASNPEGISVLANDSLGANLFTLCYWARPTTLQEGAGLERLTSRSGDLFETAIGNAQAIGGAPELSLSYYQGAWIRTRVPLPLEEWSHVVWRNRGPGPQDLDLFVNGRLLFTGPGVGAGRPGVGLLNIGTRHNGVEGFEGYMDDVRLYRAPLRAKDIAALGDFPTILKATRGPNGSSFSLTFTSLPGRTYAIDYSLSLEEGSWVSLTEALSATGPETLYADTTAGARPQAYYRVRLMLP